MVRIYGASDDLVEIENSGYEENEIGCYDSNVIIIFDDGTEILVGYGKPTGAIWFVQINKQGSAMQRLTPCEDEEAYIYSDVFEIDAEIVSHELIDR